MYRKISQSFKEQSNQLKNTINLILTPFIFLLLIILALFLFDINGILYEWLEIVTILLGYLLTFLTFYIIIIYSIRKSEQYKWKKIWNIPFNIKLFKETSHDNDIKLLVTILKDNGINTRPKVLEALRHYQCLLPHKVSGSTSIFSILALCISVLAFVFSDYFLKSETNRIITAVIIILVVLIYVAIYQLNSKVFRYIGENALNERIEMAISEIWIKSMIK